MKRTILIAVSAALFLFACKKDSGNNTNTSTTHFTVQIDGAASSFNVSQQAQWGDTVYNGLLLRGLDIQAVSATDGIEFIILMPNTRPGVGTYTVNATGYAMDASYYPGYNSTSTTFYYDNYSSLNPASTNPFQLTITAIDSIGVKGTFQGETYYTPFSTGNPDITKKKTFASGDFYVKF